jgi:hypothetical protein
MLVSYKAHPMSPLSLSRHGASIALSAKQLLHEVPVYYCSKDNIAQASKGFKKYCGKSIGKFQSISP